MATKAFSCPTEDEFAKELADESDWFTLGILLGISQTRVKEVVLQHRPEGKEKCLRELYKCLKNPKPWSEIAEALSTSVMNRRDLAEEIAKKYCGNSIHTRSEEEDESILKFLEMACSDENERVIHVDQDGFVRVDNLTDGFVRVDNLLRVNGGPPVSVSPVDIRRVVAGNAHLILEEGPPMRIRDHWGKTLRKVKEVVYKEKGLLKFLEKVCCHGTPDKELYYHQDGSVAVADLLPLRNDCTEEAIRKAVKYDINDRIVLVEGPPLKIKPTWEQRPEGLYQVPREEAIYFELITICRHGRQGLSFDEDTYVPVSKLLPLMSKYKATEEDVKKVVKNHPDCHLALKESSTLQIRANWGRREHLDKFLYMKTFFFKSSALSPNLVKSHHEAPFVIHFVNRRLWVKVKNKGITRPTDKKIEFKYKNEEITDEKEIMEKYGYHQVIIVIDLEKALKDGLRFEIIPPKKLVCQDEIVSPDYYKKVYM